MPILGHSIVHDDPMEHLAWIDYRAPCVPEQLGTAPNLHWAWQVIFEDPNGDGRAERLRLHAAHRAAPHPGEPSPNALPPFVLLEPCRPRWSMSLLLPRAHATHLDELFVQVRRLGFLAFGRFRIHLRLRHSEGEARKIDSDLIPDHKSGILGG